MMITTPEFVFFATKMEKL